MAFVPYDNDIFVSYAHADNIPQTGVVHDLGGLPT